MYFFTLEKNLKIYIELALHILQVYNLKNMKFNKVKKNLQK